MREPIDYHAEALELREQARAALKKNSFGGHLALMAEAQLSATLACALPYDPPPATWAVCADELEALREQARAVLRNRTQTSADTETFVVPIAVVARIVELVS